MSTNAKKLVPWGPEKKLKWFLAQTKKRSYREDVLVRLEALKNSAGPLFSVEQYGSLTVDPERYPLFVVQVGRDRNLPKVLITGGVHGYETSGAHGALQFLETCAAQYAQHFHLVVAPCVSPWSYETVNRLDPVMENPNRQFKDDSKAEESLFLMKYLATLGGDFSGHFDLHETTDSDRQFLPEEYAKNGLHLEGKDIAIDDGFYLIGNTGNVYPELERAMIEAVRKVTHIAQPDSRGMVYDTIPTSQGVVHGSTAGVCAAYTKATDTWGAYTTEMYPDSPRYKKLTDAERSKMCNDTQVACVRAALDYWIENRRK